MSIFDQIGSAFASDFVSGTTVNPQYQPPQRTWVDLNTNQILDVYQEVLKEWRGGHQVNGQIAFAKAIQDKFKEVNT